MKVKSDEKDSGVMFYYFMFFAKLAEKKNKKFHAVQWILQM